MENTAIVGEDTLMEIYRKATTPQYGYLWLNKAAVSDDDLFHMGLGTPGEKITWAKTHLLITMRQKNMGPHHRGLDAPDAKQKESTIKKWTP